MVSKKQRKTAAAVQAREAIRAEAAAAKAQADAKIRRQRLLVAGAVVLVVALVVALVAVVVTLGKKNEGLTGEEAKPQAALTNGGILVGQGGAAGGEAATGDDIVTVEVYSDYMCPYCGMLEQATADKLDKLVEEGKVRLVLHPISILDQYSNDTQYSSRSANAAATVAALDPEHFLAFHQALFAGQPEEGPDGLSDDEIVTIATDAGVPKDVADKFVDNTYNAWVEASTAQAAKDGVKGTPAVYLSLGDGKRELWENWVTGAIGQAVDAVKDGKKPDEGMP
ncbi:MAG: thioredoxin domain-containing protein [Micrococcales bacterium]|nr:thioredoxin domain-containing protein [Micrococcales bacterium]